MSKIQARVAMTAKVIANMKSVKISGLALSVQDNVQNLRLDELRVGSKYRMILCWSVVLAYVPIFMSPVGTFACKWPSTRWYNPDQLIEKLEVLGMLTRL